MSIHPLVLVIQNYIAMEMFQHTVNLVSDWWTVILISMAEKLCVCMHACVCMFVCMCVYVCVCVCVCMHMHAYVCMCVWCVWCVCVIGEVIGMAQ